MCDLLFILEHTIKRRYLVTRLDASVHASLIFRWNDRNETTGAWHEVVGRVLCVQGIKLECEIENEKLKIHS